MYSEIWYKIEDFKDVENDKYEISNFGNVRKKDKYLKQTLNKRGGYPCVSLYSCLSQKTYFVCIHALMKYYIFNITDPEIFINHKDGIKTNNMIHNLELSNALHNTHHAIDTGLFIANKILDSDIESIRNYVLNNKDIYSYVEISNRFNIHLSAVYRIINGTIRKKSNLEDLSIHMKTFENKILRDKDSILIRIFEHNESISKVAKSYGYDFYTIKKLVKLYLSGELEITSTTIESINVTPKENKAS